MKSRRLRADSDGGGDISFEEFFDFTQKLTFHMASVGDTHELAKDMFALIDADAVARSRCTRCTRWCPICWAWI